MTTNAAGAISLLQISLGIPFRATVNNLLTNYVITLATEQVNGTQPANAVSGPTGTSVQAYDITQSAILPTGCGSTTVGTGAATPVPLPVFAWLLLSGLGVFGVIRRNLLMGAAL